MSNFRREAKQTAFPREFRLAVSVNIYPRCSTLCKSGLRYYLCPFAYPWVPLSSPFLFYSRICFRVVWTERAKLIRSTSAASHCLSFPQRQLRRGFLCSREGGPLRWLGVAERTPVPNVSTLRGVRIRVYAVGECFAYLQFWRSFSFRLFISCPLFCFLVSTLLVNKYSGVHERSLADKV